MQLPHISEYRQQVHNRRSAFKTLIKDKDRGQKSSRTKIAAGALAPPPVK